MKDLSKIATRQFVLSQIRGTGFHLRVGFCF